MAGGFDPIDPERCAHYAGFAAHLDRRSFDFIYWFLFVAVIGMLFLASWKYSGDLETIRVRGLEPGSREYKNKMLKCMAICAGYAAVSVVAVVMEVYALMALQFCDGEDLMPLYWSTWTMMQVGSLIAIFGIMLAMFNSLRGRKNPPWALALGTPVLVVAGIGHAVHGAVRKRARRVRSLSRGRRRRNGSASASSSNGQLDRLETGDLPRMSREQTLRADDSEKEDAEISAKFLGFTPGGAPIVKFTDEPGKIEPDQGVVIGRSDGHVIIAFRRAMKVVNGSNASLGNGGGRAGTPGPSVTVPSGGGGGGGAAAAEPSSNMARSLRSATPPVTPRSPIVRIAPPPGTRDSPV